MKAPLRVYVDQLHLDSADTAALTRLECLAREGRVRAPISLVHFLESMKDQPARRQRVRRRLLTISDGEILPVEIAVADQEVEALRKGLGVAWVKSRVITCNVWNWAVTSHAPLFLRLLRSQRPVTVRTLFQLLDHVPDDRRIAGLVDTILTKHASAANAFHQPSWTATKQRAGLLSFPDTPLSQGSSFRALECRWRLQRAIREARPGGLESNDLPDLAFLCVALPYLDGVCVDRRMLARIEEARPHCATRWARAFRKLPELVQWVDEATS